MKNAAHRVAVSTRMKTVNGDEISAVGCDGQKEGSGCRVSGRLAQRYEGVHENAPATLSLTHAGGMRRLRDGWMMRP